MFVVNIEKLTINNHNYRKVLHTGKNSQLVLMSIPVNSGIGEETHSETDQIIFIVDGKGEALLSNEIRKIEEHDAVFIPAGTLHNIKNIGDSELKLFTVYSPPEHPDGEIQETKSI